MVAPPLRLYNTRTRREGEFAPLSEGAVRVYSCGPTVYSHQHIGNMKPYVFSDTLRRVLRWKGYAVRQVINITDVGHLTSDEDDGEDKMEVGARREGRTIWEIAEHYTRLFQNDLEALRIFSPDVWCKATDHIEEMIAFAAVLEEKGYCYRLPTGLYFDTARLDGYGQLARLNVKGQREGARVDPVEGRRNPSDFAVWRATPPGEQRQMEWDSRWGRGAPGWHLECSVMSMKYLGDHFDIHTGGADHIPVHHTNEIAQSEAYLEDGQPWVPWWLHEEFVNLKGAKIAKSAGGGPVVGDLVERGSHPLVYRFLLLQAHYRTQIEFDWDALEGAKTGLRRLLDRFSRAGRAGPTLTTYEDAMAALSSDAGRRYLADFDAALSDDLNTARALTAVTGASRDEALPASDLAALARAFDAVLAIGLADLKPEDLDLRRGGTDVDAETVERLVAERDAARASRDYARADELRTRLRGLGVELEDSPSGTTWRWA
ncbi:MAG: cysteine--tRNA ligase [Acidimicrobiales bacterium]